MIENSSERNYLNIKGYIKLKKDPKMEQFSIENILVANSIVRNTEWVLGMVLFLKGESLKIRNMKPKNRISNDFFHKINVGIIILFIEIIIFLVVIFTYLLKIRAFFYSCSRPCRNISVIMWFF